MWLNISIFALKLLPLCMHSSKWFQHDLNYDNKDKKHSGQLLHKYAYYLYRDCRIDSGKDLSLEKHIHTLITHFVVLTEDMWTPDETCVTTWATRTRTLPEIFCIEATKEVPYSENPSLKEKLRRWANA